MSPIGSCSPEWDNILGDCGTLRRRSVAERNSSQGAGPAPSASWPMPDADRPSVTRSCCHSMSPYAWSPLAEMGWDHLTMISQNVFSICFFLCEIFCHSNIKSNFSLLSWQSSEKFVKFVMWYMTNLFSLLKKQTNNTTK